MPLHGCVAPWVLDHIPEDFIPTELKWRHLIKKDRIAYKKLLAKGGATETSDDSLSPHRRLQRATRKDIETAETTRHLTPAAFRLQTRLWSQACHLRRLLL